MNQLKVEQRTHPIWNEGAHNLIGHKIVGKDQYIYSSAKGKISLVQIYGYPLNIGETYEQSWEHFQWEIYSLEGKLFYDVERYDTKEDAELKIKEYLDK